MLAGTATSGQCDLRGLDPVKTSTDALKALGNHFVWTGPCQPYVRLPRTRIIKVMFARGDYKW